MPKRLQNLARSSAKMQHRLSTAEQATTLLADALRSLASVAIWFACILLLRTPATVKCRLNKMVWASWYPVAMKWYVQCVSTSRLFFWETEYVPKKPQLAISNMVDKRLGDGHEIYQGDLFVLCWAQSCSRKSQRRWFYFPCNEISPNIHSHRGRWSRRWCRINPFS